MRVYRELVNNRHYTIEKKRKKKVAKIYCIFIILYVHPLSITIHRLYILYIYKAKKKKRVNTSLYACLLSIWSTWNQPIAVCPLGHTIRSIPTSPTT